jgi:hypothetical protein
VEYEHPYLTIDYYYTCDRHNWHYVTKLNVTQVITTRVSDYFALQTIYVACQNTCLYSWASLADVERSARQPPRSQGELVSVNMDYSDAVRVAKALKHFGVLYKASAAPRGKFD